MSRNVSMRLILAPLAAALLAVVGLAPAQAPDAERFQFPTSDNGAAFHFSSFPDLFNWNIKYPEPGWEDAMDWFLDGMKAEGQAFSLNAGDIMDARWWESPEQVRRKTQEYWGGMKRRFDDKDIKLYIAPGDHEYGDDAGLRKMKLAPIYGEQFAKIFTQHPQNGPAHKKGLAYHFAHHNLAVISVDTFEDAGNHMSMTVSGEQFKWFKETLEFYKDKEFIIVQGHVPVFGPVNSKNSSANMLAGGGPQSEFWRAMVEHDVDVYLCGEHHRMTCKKREGVWQVVHGALWGTQTDINYMRGSVWPGKLTLELFEFDVEYAGGSLGDHPNRRGNGPKEKVRISDAALQNGPRLVGRLVIEATPDGNTTTEATGEFAKYPEHKVIEPSGPELSRKGWKAIRASSVSTFNGKVPANAIDGDPNTVWHTEWRDSKPGHPHELVIDMGAVTRMGGFVYLARPDGQNGTLTEYEFYVSNNVDDFGEPVSKGTFAAAGRRNVARFDQAVEGRYLKLKSLAAVGGQPYACVAEIYVTAP